MSYSPGENAEWEQDPSKEQAALIQVSYPALHHSTWYTVVGLIMLQPIFSMSPKSGWGGEGLSYLIHENWSIVQETFHALENILKNVSIQIANKLGNLKKKFKRTLPWTLPRNSWTLSTLSHYTYLRYILILFLHLCLECLRASPFRICTEFMCIFLPFHHVCLISFASDSFLV
jgi:hypothetical protein